MILKFPALFSAQLQFSHRVLKAITMIPLRLDCLNDLPFESKNPITIPITVEAPAYFLGLEALDDGSGYLIVTDFTSVGKSPSKCLLWNRKFDLLELGPLPQDQLFVIYCKGPSFSNLKRRVSKNNLSHKSGCYFLITFDIQMINGDLKATLVMLSKRRHIRESLPDDTPITNRFKDRCLEQTKSIHTFFKDSIRDTIDTQSWSATGSSSKSIRSRSPLPSSRHSRKTPRRAPQATDLTFQQNPRYVDNTQVQVELDVTLKSADTMISQAVPQVPNTSLLSDSMFQPEVTKANEEITSNSNTTSNGKSTVLELSSPRVSVRKLHQSLQIQSLQSSRNTDKPSQLQIQSLELSQSTQGQMQLQLQSIILTENYDEFVVNRVSISKLKSISNDFIGLDETHTFEVKGFVRLTMPFTDFIVKPYKRTLKVSNLRFFFFEDLRDTSDYLILDFITCQEICRFLGISEEEDCLPKFAAINKDLESLVSRSTYSLFTVTAKSFGSPRISYWTCTDTLSKLVNPQ